MIVGKDRAREDKAMVVGEIIQGFVVMFASLGIAGGLIELGLYLLGIPASWHGWAGCVMIAWGIAVAVKTVTKDAPND